MGNIRVLYSFPERIGTVGIGMTAWHQVTALLHQGVQVQLYTGSCEREIQGLDDLKETLVLGGIKIPLRLLGVRRTIGWHDEIVARSLLRNHDSNRIDIVHCWPSGSLKTLQTSRKLGIKTVLERPNTHTRYAFGVVQAECEKLGLKPIRAHSHSFDACRLKHEEEEFELADRLLCPSEFVAKTFLDLGFKKEKLALHQYGFDPSYFDCSLSTSTRNEGQPFTMVFLGSCEPRKGLHYALEAWLKTTACRTGRFLICGEYIPKYREFLSGMLSHPSIQEVGYLDDARTVLPKCHALILPSIEEGSALVTYEARACGCVLLVSEASGAKCTHMHDGLVHKVGDVLTLRNHIEALASDTKLLKRLRDNSIAGLSELTWDKAAELLIRAYRECMGETEEALKSVKI